MAIIYSYPTVNPERTDLILGTDVSVAGKPTKNFTVQSIIDLVTVATGDLQTVLDLGNVATNRDIDLTNNAFRGGSFVTTGSATISGTVATGFTNVTSTEFTGTIATPAQPNITSLGTLSALVISGPISGTSLIVNSALSGAQNDNIVSALAIKTYVDNKVGLYDTLQEVLANGNTTGGTDIVVSTGDNITFTNTSKILMGTTAVDNLEIYNDSANSFIIDKSPGVLKIQTSSLSVLNEAGGATLLTAVDGAGVSLYHNNAKTIETLSGGAKVTGAFQATTSGTFASLVNTGTYTDSSGDVGTAGQILSSTGSGTNWVTELPLYTWSYEGTNIPSGTAMTVTDGTNITTTWDAANYDLTIATTGVPDGSGAANQVTYWSDADTLTGAAGFTFAGGATGKVAIAGELEVGGVLTDGTFTGSAGTYTGYLSITSTDFVGALTGNASTATALAVSGAIALTGDTTSTGGPYTYTSGGAISIATTIADTTVTGKVLTNLPTPTSATIAASDTILDAMAKLQGQITGIPQGLVYKGTWNASTNTPTLASGTGVTGEFYIVSVAGTTNLDGITDWQVGDWAIFVEVGATDTWQKIDNTSAILGSGTANKIAKWTGSNTLATGLISDDGSTVTVGNSGNLVVEGNTTLGDADTDTTTVKGPGVFEETAQFNVGIGLGSTPSYGTAGQVLTSGGGSATANTWTTPTTGTVTSVTAGTGITIGGTAADPTVAIDTVGSNNAIEVLGFVTPTTGDFLWISDVSDSSTLKKVSVSDLVALDSARSLSAVLAVGNTSGANDILMADNQAVKFGAGNDLRLYHNGTNSNIENFTGTLQIIQNLDDGDISFKSDNGSGGTTEYFRLDGGIESIVVSKDILIGDDTSKLKFGASQDLEIYHDGTNSVINNKTGDLILEQNQDDGDIVFKADNGSGGTTEYFRVDGGAVETRFSKSTRHFDDVGAYFGDSADLQIYHDASNSYILNSTGSLIIGQAAGAIALRPVTGENGILIVENAAVTLYYDNSEKLETTSSGIRMRGPRITFDPTPNSGSNSEYGTIIADSTYGLRLRGSVSGTNSEKGGIYVQQSVVKFPGEVVGVSSPNPEITMMQINRTILGSGGNVLTIGDATSFGLGYKANSVFQGDVDIKGDLTVDGHIIHGGGGGGTGKGGQFTKLFTSVSGGSIAFTIDRATTGSMIFDVMLTSDTSTSCAIAKKYTVVKSYGASPLYNKILDTGPDFNGSDFTVVFAQHTTDTSIKCTITPQTTATQKIGITLDLGFGQNDATVVMN